MYTNKPHTSANAIIDCTKYLSEYFEIIAESCRHRMSAIQLAQRPLAAAACGIAPDCHTDDSRRDVFRQRT